MIKENLFQEVDLDTLQNDELENLYSDLNQFNKYVYDFVIDYYKYIYQVKSYGTNYDLSMLEAHLIRDIADDPGITASILAQKWDKTPAYMSQSISKLEKKDLIYRQLNEENRKFYNIYLTEKGKDFDLRHKKYDIKSIITTNRKLMEKFSLDDLIKMRLIMKEYSKIILSEEI